MKPQAYVHAAFAALVAAVPCASAGMGLGNAAPVVDSVAVSPALAPANGTATISCAAHDTDGSVVKLTVSVSGGTLPGGGASEDVAITGASVSGTIAWTTPAAGDYTVTCTAVDGGAGFSPPAQSEPVSIVATVVASSPPVVDRLTASSTKVYAGGDTVKLAGTAHDPSGGELRYEWSATCGSLASSGANATWTAPGEAAVCTVTFTAVGAGGRASASVSIDVAWMRAAGTYVADTAREFSPERIAVDAAGFFYVTNSRMGTVQVFTPLGEPLRAIPAGGAVAGVALSPRGLWVTDRDRGAVKLIDGTGKLLGALGAGAGEFVRPLDVAVNGATGAVYVADGEAAVVRVFSALGAPLGTLSVAGGFPVGVAPDPLTGSTYVSDAANGTVRVYDASGTQIATFGSFGGGSGQLTRAAGVTLAVDGNIYVVDAFQARIAAFSRTGTFLAFSGELGSDPGQLWVPLGIAADPNGRLLVTNTMLGRIETFALRGSIAPVCPATDSDCDGMPNDWEVAHGLDPFNPRDAYVDSDKDGLLNIDEYRHGSDPFKVDTDGDGWSDGDEVASGFDPTDPYDHRPVLTASAPAESGPGLVRISSSVRSDVPCTVAWKQVGGPTVSLRAGLGTSPSYVARKAGVYAMEGVATCGGVASQAAIVSTRILDVAPRADAGRIVVAERREPVRLDGSFSSDANGDAPLSFGWDQTVGTAVTGPAGGSGLSLDLQTAGYYAFQLTAMDPMGNAASAEVPVFVVGGGDKGPAAVAATPVSTEVGKSTTLYAGASVGRGAQPSYVWTQISGPAVDLGGATSPSASFVPPAAGAYAFEVTVLQGELRSPPARVDVYAASAASALPRAVAAAVKGPVAAGEPVALDGSRSASGAGGSLDYAWRQVSGPAAGLTDADRPVATVVPFGAGSFVFELTVKEGAAVGVPARVGFEADAAGVVRPVAVAKGPATALVNEMVTLDGASSTAAAGKALRYRWTQVAGPWVPLDTADPARPGLRARGAGTYAFELEVDDGTVRSAPSRVSIQVLDKHEATR